MRKKLLSVIIAAAMLFTGLSVMADNEAEQNTGGQRFKRTDITVSSVNGSLISGMFEEEEFSISVNSDTLYLDNDGNNASLSDIKEEDFIYIYEKNGSASVIIISDDDSANSVDVDRYTAVTSQFGVLVNSANTLVLTNTYNAFDLYGNPAEDLENKDLAVFFKITNDYQAPETTSPVKIVVLGNLGSGSSLSGRDDKAENGGETQDIDNSEDNSPENTKNETVPNTDKETVSDTEKRPAATLRPISVTTPKSNTTAAPASETETSDEALKSTSAPDSASSGKKSTPKPSVASSSPVSSAAPSPCPYDGTIKVIINGEYVDFSKYNNVLPKIENDRTLIPIRAIIEGLGAKIEWHETGEIEINKDGVEILLTIGRLSAVVGGKTVELDAAPKIENDRTLVPLRFITENLGSKVDWDGETYTVIITD